MTAHAHDGHVGHGGPAHEHDHGHEHGQGHGHEHEHGHGHEHGHEHATGFRGVLREFFVPHTHDASDSVDDALEASAQGIRALKVSLLVLLATTVLQLAVVLVSSSVALLADTVHNFSDALTAVPLWVAFLLGRRAATRRYPYGYGRAEDLAGLFIVAVVALSAIVAAWQSIDRLIRPQLIDNLGWVIVAGVIGFAGNEAVAIYRIRVGRRIGSAALVADGVHARTDGFTSLAVVLGALGVMAGFPLADPIVGLLITVAILFVLKGAALDIYRRLMDAVDPDLVDTAESALRNVNGVIDIESLRLRWIGHRLHAETALIVNPDLSVVDAHAISTAAHHHLLHEVPKLATATVHVSPAGPEGEAHHAQLQHHH